MMKAIKKPVGCCQLNGTLNKIISRKKKTNSKSFLKMICYSENAELQLPNADCL